MKILISVGTLEHGGAERVVSNLSRTLTSLGHEVELLLYYDRPMFYSVDSGVKITVDEIAMGGKRNVLHHVLWRRKYIKKVAPDVVISFLAVFNMLNIVAMFGLHIPLIVADRNDPRKVPTNGIIRKGRDFLYRFADRVVVQSQYNFDYFSPAVQKKCDVIYNPVNVTTYQGAGLSTQSSKRIVSVGRIIKQKNPGMLLSAFEKIADEFPEYTLSFYGEGDMRQALATSVKDSALSGRIFFHGAVKGIFQQIQDADLYVMTSDYEGLPNALLEAMCIGIPVISTKVSGATDFIKSGVNGELVDIDDAAGLAEAMRMLLSDEHLRKSYGEKAAKLAEELEESHITNNWLACIEKCKS